MAGLFGISFIVDLKDSYVVIGVLATINAMLSLVLGASGRHLAHFRPHGYDGVIRVVVTDDNKKIFSLELNSDPDDLTSHKEVLFKIDTSPSPS